ncbi:MAG: T9SS type A sorting domain-containing protein [Flavobacteriaceae bacterium]
MKIPVLSLFLFIISFGFSQDYLPMLEEDQIWSVEINYEPFGDDFPSYTQVEQVYVEDDIEINGQIYKRVYSNPNTSSCLLREENGIIYKITDQNTMDEVIMYDFTLETGDIFVFSYENNVYCSYSGDNNGLEEMEVVNTSIQFIADENRKVIEFENDGYGLSEVWIEGIGSNRGFDPFNITIDITGLNKLICFTKDNTTYFFNDATDCGFLHLPEVFKNKIVLYPNPVTSKSKLQLPEVAKINSIKIYNPAGKIIKEENINTTSFTINASQFKSGLYFYQVFSDGLLLKTDKFIVK